MKDTFVRGALAGTVGTLADNLIHWSAYFLFKTSPTAFYISALIFPFKKPSGVHLAFGMFAHLMSGGILGLFLALIFKCFGKDHPYFKGLSLGIVMWIVHVAIIPNLVKPRPYI